MLHGNRLVRDRMPDQLSRLEHIKRPQILIRAAQLGMRDYRKTRHAGTLLADLSVNDLVARFDRLFWREAELDRERVTGTASYSAAKHIEVLSALIVEAELLRQSAA